MDDIEKIEEKVEESKKAESAEIVEKKEEEAVAVSVPTIEYEVDKSKTFSEQAKDVVGVMATKKALEDEQLVKDITERKKDELKESADKTLKEEKAKGKDAETKLQHANYGVYEGVATYAGIKKPLPNIMQKILFAILSFIQTVFLVLIGTPVSVINIIADCINSIVKKLSEIAKSARILVVSLLGLGVISLIIFVIIQLLRRYGIITG